MTTEERIAKLKILTGETSEEVLSTYLDMASQRVLEKLYPFGYPEGTTIPAKYEMTLLEITVYMVNKRGAEGETAHNENGINRSYGSSSVPETMLKNIIPFCGTFSTGSDNT